MGFTRIGSPQEDDICLLDLLIRVRPASRSKNHRQTGDAWRMSGTVATIDIVAAHHHPRELLRNEIHFVRRLRATEHTERPASALLLRGFQSACRPVQSLIPRGWAENAVLRVVANGKLLFARSDPQRGVIRMLLDL